MNVCQTCLGKKGGCGFCSIGGEAKSPAGMVASGGVVSHPEMMRMQREHNLHQSRMIEDAAMGIKSFTPEHYENGGEDYIDRTFRTKTPDEIRGAMCFSMGKYVDRLGKKDDEVNELTKIIDYATRYKTHLEKGSK